MEEEKIISKYKLVANKNQFLICVCVYVCKIHLLLNKDFFFSHILFDLYKPLEGRRSYFSYFLAHMRKNMKFIKTVALM